jgi:hypothetical protein
MPPIQTSMTIAEIVEQHPTLMPIFQQWGLDPEQHKALHHESIQASCMMMDLDLNTLLAELEATLPV